MLTTGMAAKPETPDKPERILSDIELARLYLDLWEKNLCLCAREAEPPRPDTGIKHPDPR